MQPHHTLKIKILTTLNLHYLRLLIHKWRTTFWPIWGDFHRFFSNFLSSSLAKGFDLHRSSRTLGISCYQKGFFLNFDWNLQKQFDQPKLQDISDLTKIARNIWFNWRCFRTVYLLVSLRRIAQTFLFFKSFCLSLYDACIIQWCVNK